MQDPLKLPPIPAPPPSQTAASAPPLPDLSTVAELAKAAAPEAIKALHAIGHDAEEKGATRVAALNAILDRAEGKVGIAMQDNSTNYTVIINQINRAMGKTTPATTIDLEPQP